MSETAEKHYILPPERFYGHIQAASQRIEISLSASVDYSGHLSLDVDPIKDLAGGLELKRSLSSPGNTVDEFQLECESSDGKRLTSDRAYLDYCRDKFTLIDCSQEKRLASNREFYTEFYIKLRTAEACLTMKASERCDLPQIGLRLLGFRSFSPLCATTRLGTIEAWEVRADTANEITGKIAIQGQRDPSSNWRSEAKRLLDDLRLMLGFARGAPLRVPIMEFYHGDCVQCIFYEVEGCLPYMAPFHHLNLDPIFSTAVKNIDIIAKHRDLLETMIGWLLVTTDYEEIRFLSGMTALESAVSKLLNDTILEDQIFQELKQRIQKLIKKDFKLKKNDRAAIYQKLPELNRYTLKHKLKFLFDRLNIARTDIDDCAISCLVDLRNKIIHEGATPAIECLRGSDEILREILVRLVLAIIRFEGTYESYVGGRHTRSFPDCKLSE